MLNFFHDDFECFYGLLFEEILDNAFYWKFADLLRIAIGSFENDNFIFVFNQFCVALYQLSALYTTAQFPKCVKVKYTIAKLMETLYANETRGDLF